MKTNNCSILKDNRIQFMFLILSYIGLWLLYCLRSPIDFGTYYMWCEDGIVLFQDAHDSGIKSLFYTANGTLWVFQRFIGLLCYYLSYIFNNISIYPISLSIITKLIEVASIFYFACSKFDWIIKSRWLRVFVSASILLAIPQNAYDLVDCDTSSPFFFSFAIFLIGLNAFNKEHPQELSLTETIFLIIDALSSANTPFVLGVTFLRFISFVYLVKKTDNMQTEKLVCFSIKVILISLASIAQTLTIISSGRASVKLDIFNRMLSTFENFIWFPYSNIYLQAIPFIIVGMLLWALLVYLSKISILPVIYGVCFSLSYLFLCSLTDNAYNFFQEHPGRFFFTSYSLSVFYLGWFAYLLLNGKITRIISIIIIILELIVLLTHYPIYKSGGEHQVIECFKNNTSTYDRNGDKTLIINIAPLMSVFGILVPGNLPSSSNNNSVRYEKNLTKSKDTPYIIETTVINESGSPIKEAFLIGENDNLYLGSYSLKKENTNNGERIEIGFCNNVEVNHNIIEPYTLLLLTEDNQLIQLPNIDV